MEFLAKLNFYGPLFKFKYARPLLILRKKIIIKITNFFRSIFVKLENKQSNADIESLQNIKINQKSLDNLEIYKKEFKNKNFCFIEDLIDDEDFNQIKNNFPEKKYFYAPSDPFKNYNFGFRNYKMLNPNHFQMKNSNYIEKFPVHKKLYNFIQSSEFKNFLNSILSKQNYSNTIIISSYASSNSFLIPHIDSVYDDENVKNIINTIYFIDGLDDANNSGGTGIYNDSEFNEPIFEPKKIRNSMIIYNSKSSFWHGFKIMKKNSFRFAVVQNLKK